MFSLKNAGSWLWQFFFKWPIMNRFCLSNLDAPNHIYVHMFFLYRYIHCFIVNKYLFLFWISWVVELLEPWCDVQIYFVYRFILCYFCFKWFRLINILKFCIKFSYFSCFFTCGWSQLNACCCFFLLFTCFVVLLL